MTSLLSGKNTAKRVVPMVLLALMLLVGFVIPAMAMPPGADPGPSLSVDWGRIITEALVVSIPLLLPALFLWIYTHAAMAWKDLKAKQPQLSWYLESAALIAVKGAEELGAFDDLKDKKVWAINYVQKYMDAHGLHNVDVSLISGAIEAAVLEVFNKDRLPKPVLPAPEQTIPATKEPIENAAQQIVK